MSKVETAGRSLMRLSYMSALVAAVGVAVLAGFVESQRREAFRQATRSDVLDRLALLRTQIQGAVDSNVRLVTGLVAVVEFQPDIDRAQFTRLATRLIRGRTEIRAIAVAPDLVVSMLHPLEGNEAALGLDYRTLPDQLPAVLLARDRAATVLAGPVDLVQGGRGFIIRMPVFEAGDGFRGRFWGIVSTVIDEGAFYRAGGLAAADLPIDVALVGRDGMPGDGEVFFGDPAILERDPVTARVALPFGAWELAATPRGGWGETTGLWTLRSIFLGVGLLIVLPILGAGGLAESRRRKLAVIEEREAELSRLSWRLEFALAASQVGVWDVDLATDELLWDERTKALFGFPGRTGLFNDTDWQGVLHPEDRERAVAQAEAAIAGDGKFVSEYRIVRGDGEVRHIRDMAALYRGKDGSRRLVGLVWDVTPDVERQEELNLRRLEAEAATVAKSRFLAAMSHEIRTPLGGVIGLLGLMLAGRLAGKQRERAKIALASAQSLLQILNEILDFSKLEANQVRLVEDGVDVRQLVGEVLELMAAGAEQKGITLRREIAARVPERVVTDPMRLRQVLTNLVSNATKFTDRGHVSVAVDHVPSADGGELVIEVEDTGIGIALEEHDRIFQRFVQVDNSAARRVGGTGLGLAIIKQLLELMDGSIAVKSVPGRGSRFVVRLPARPGAATEPAPAPGGGAPEGSGMSPPLRVLLAEDNPTNRYLITAYLQAAGHAVVPATTGREAVAAAEEGGFDAVLMDVQMPEMDGLAAARAIRALPAPAGGVPIIALTASAMPGDREACLAAGMTEYLSKPIEVPALHAALRRARAGAADDGLSPAVSRQEPGGPGLWTGLRASP